MEHDAIPLTDVGRAQAQALAELLPQNPSEVYVSPFVRAQHTAQAYCERVGLRPQVLDVLREFETIDPNLLQGMTGEQRRPIAEAYWSDADPHKRMGARAETFAEFERRVSAFHTSALAELPDRTVLFGHGMWIGLLCWRLVGFSAADGLGMKTFRRFQLGFPMPNGATYRLQEARPNHWTFQADEVTMRHMSALAEA